MRKRIKEQYNPHLISQRNRRNQPTKRKRKKQTLLQSLAAVVLPYAYLGFCTRGFAGQNAGY